MSANILSFAIGVGILGVGGEMILNGSLKKDKSMVATIVKCVIFVVGIAFVILPIKAMMGSNSQKKQWRKQLNRGVQLTGQSLRDDFSAFRQTGAKVKKRVRGMLTTL